MRVISRKKLVEFWEVHAEAEAPLHAWFTLMTITRSENPHQSKQAFGAVDFSVATPRSSTSAAASSDSS